MSRPAGPGDARAYASRAAEFQLAAHHALNEGLYVAAAGNAVNAGINAASAVTAARLGQRWAGPHEDAADFTRRAGPEGVRVANDLARLLAIKNEAQYDPVPISHTKAARAVNWAERAVRIAVDVINSLNRQP
jgi:hypothetical protein